MASNSVTTLHHAYQQQMYSWSAMRDALAGEDAIKRKNSQYLPIPAAYLEDEQRIAPSSQGISSHPLDREELYPLSSVHNPSYHRIPAYAAYKARAQYPNLVSYLYRGLMGLALADSPAIHLPPELEYLEDQYATPDGMNLSRLFVKVLGETLLMGRSIIIPDPSPDDNRFYIQSYTAESLINWKSINDDPRLLVFQERVEDPFNEDPFTHERVDQYRVQQLIDGIYYTFVYDEHGELLAPPIAPTYLGRTLEYIPGHVIGSLNNNLDPDPPPLSPVASTAISIYQKNADLSLAEFLTCNPTLVITGVTEELRTLTTGPTTAFTISNPQAKVFYTETDTSALEFVHKHIGDLYDRAILYGAQLLDSSKKSAETAETTRLRQTAAGATLRSVVTTVGEGFQQTLRTIARWQGLSEEKIAQIKFSPLTEFGSNLTPQEQKELVASWLAGAISHRTVLSNFRKAGILGEGRTEEDEIERLIEEANDPNSPRNLVDATLTGTDTGGQSSGVVSNGKTTDGDDDDDDDEEEDDASSTRKDA